MLVYWIAIIVATVPLMVIANQSTIKTSLSLAWKKISMKKTQFWGFLADQTFGRKTGLYTFLDSSEAADNMAESVEDITAALTAPRPKKAMIYKVTNQSMISHNSNMAREGLTDGVRYFNDKGSTSPISSPSGR